MSEPDSASIAALIDAYIATQPEAKRADMQALHRLILDLMPGCQLWFLDGKDENGKIVSNPNVGYGHQVLTYADGTTRDFYRMGFSANTSGITVYIMGLDDRTYLPTTYGGTIGKASVTGYCIKFKALKDIDVAVLGAAIRYRAGLPN